MTTSTESGAIDASAWGILVHGGAADVPQANRARHEAGCRAAAERAAEVLRDGGSAMQAVELAVRILEDDPSYNAGTGASLTRDGDVSFDAAIMDGATLDAGAVCALGPFKNPISVARAVANRGDHVLYAGEGADLFALSEGFARVDSASLATEGARASLERVLSAGAGAKGWAGGTVGAVARDGSGHVAAATSTGGMMGKPRGRVGDTPLIGAGTYADDARGAISATGEGEGIMRICLSYAVLEAIHAGTRGPSSPKVTAAAERCLRDMRTRVGATGGVIIALPPGELGGGERGGGGFAWARSTPTMSWAAARAGGDIVSGI